MRNSEIVALVRRELRAMLKLAPWLLAAVLVAAFLWQIGSDGTAGLYQSPEGLFQSPPEATVTAVPPSPTSPPTEAPTVEPTVPLLTDTPSATDTTTPTVPATLTPTASATLEPTATPTVVTATATPIPSPTAGTVEATPTSSQRYPEGDSGLKFEWGMLFDSVALGVTYLWLCCGVLVLFSIPVAFAILWVVSKRQRQPEGEEAEEPGQPEEGEE
jgi:hypothetical protein